MRLDGFFGVDSFYEDACGSTQNNEDISALDGRGRNGHLLKLFIGMIVSLLICCHMFLCLLYHLWC